MPRLLRPPGTLAEWEANVGAECTALARSHPRYGARLTDDVFAEVCERGYAILPAYLPQRQVADMGAAIRRIMPPLDEWLAKGETPAQQINEMFPYDCEQANALNQAICNDPEALCFSARWLGTDDMHYRPGLGMARYPPEPGVGLEPEPEGWTDAAQGAHIDNGNNSLLPPTMDRRHSQIIFWFILEDTDVDQGPTVMWPTKMRADGPVADMDSPAPFVGPAGSLCIFTNYSMHAASKYRRAEGQRYIWKHAWGRADYFWEGTAHYTNFGGTPNWQRFIAELNPRQRELFRLPAPGHDYYTAESLAALEVMYPGFDRDGVYAAAMAPVAAADDDGALPWEARL